MYMIKKKYKYICETCGKEQIYNSPEDAYKDGWDIPPYMGMYKILSPRTCPDCTIDTTVWWKVQMSAFDNLNSHDLEIIARIKQEPEIFEIEIDEED